MGNQCYFADMQRTALDRMTARDTSVPSFIIRLYVNDLTPQVGVTLPGDFLEASFDGYTQYPLDSWGAPTSVYPHAVSEHPLLLWACTGSGGGAQTVYGYWVTDGTGLLLWAERFDTPVFMNDIPDYIYFRPIFRYQSLYHSAYPTDPLVPARIQEDGRLLFCNAALGLGFAAGFTVHLYQNDPGITDTMVIGDFTECNFGSYITKDASTWSAALYNPVSGFMEAGAGNKFWIVGSGGPSQDAYGFYLTENGTGDLVYARKFLTPQSANSGDLVTLLPVLSNYTDFLM